MKRTDFWIACLIAFVVCIYMIAIENQWAEFEAMLPELQQIAEDNLANITGDR